jgi:starvation-inducible DNA-binding protein
MDELINALRVTVANTVALKYKAHGYHWNVEGEDFATWHETFGEIWEDYNEAIDTAAEWMRKLNTYAPFKLSRFVELTTIPETDVTSAPLIMAADLLDSINIENAQLKDVFDLATAQREQGLANFVADRLAMNERWRWFLTVSLKNVGDD